ncbi:MAG: hypothetical protein R3C41_12265 [Calditrichia bacterium]
MILYLQKINQREYGLSASDSGNDRNISEALLKDLVKAPEITIVFPPDLTEAEARNIFRSLIDAQVKKHRRWMLFHRCDAAIQHSADDHSGSECGVILHRVASIFALQIAKRRTKSTLRNAAEIRSRELPENNRLHFICKNLFQTIKIPPFYVNRFR